MLNRSLNYALQALKQEIIGFRLDYSVEVNEKAEHRIASITISGTLPFSSII
jgi:hypothetical protein